LSLPFIAFPEPSPQSKTEFEAKTSPINVTPSSNTRYGIKEVKEDALWLSKEAKIDELSALRVVVEECQTRTSAQLRGRLTTEELTGMQDAGGPSQLAVPVPLLSQAADADLVEKDFQSLESRRLRILRTYYSERQFILKVVSSLFQNHLDRSAGGNGEGKGKEGAEPSSIVARVSEGLFRQMTESEEWLQRCITAIGINVKNIDNSKEFFKESNLQADVELEWINAQIVEATHTMELTFLIIDAMGNIISSKAVLEWFKLVVGRQFFQLDSVSTLRHIFPCDIYLHKHLGRAIYSDLCITLAVSYCYHIGGNIVRRLLRRLPFD
jgi:nuclear pore complex protein Nup188